MPLSHSPGNAHADFGEAMAVIGGELRKINFLAFDLPHGDGCYVAAYPTETTEACCDDHNAAFAFFGGVPRSILYDNMKRAVCPHPGAMGSGNANARLHGASVPVSSSTTCTAGRARAYDNGKVEGLVSSHPADHSWSPSRLQKASRLSTMLSPNSAAGARRRGCGAITRPSASVSSEIV